MSDVPTPKPKSKTLIVEDDAIAAGALAKLLASNGHEVQTAGTIDDALCSFAWGPQSIILDLILPDGNGVTVLRRARKTPNHTRVAIVTAVEDPFGIDQITDLEPDAIFEKPVDPHVLLNWVDGRKVPRKKNVR